MEILTETQILALIFCLVLSLIAYKTKQPAIASISTIALCIIGFDVYSTSDDLLLLGLCLMLAAVQFIVCLPSSGRR